MKGDVMVSKRIRLLITVVLLLNSGCAFAASKPHEPPPRFKEILQGSLTVGQFDTETLKYERDSYRNELVVNVWIKTKPDENNGRYSLNHYLFRVNEREYMLLDLIQYNNLVGNITYHKSNIYDMTLWTKIIPETEVENWYVPVLKYVQANDKKLKNQYNKQLTSEFH